MGIKIPHEVALFLNFLGVPYPDVDEDQVRELGRQVQDFATNVATTYESATGAIRDMSSVYSGDSYEELVASWARMSATHMRDLDQACRFVGKALEYAAEVIAVVKVAVLGELAALAASYASLMAATAATLGGSAALTMAYRAAASRLLTAMEQMLMGYVASEVIGRAIEPFEATVERMINHVVYGTAASILKVPPSGSSPRPLYIEPDEVLRYADLLDKYADEIVEHSAKFADNVAALDFVTAGPLGEPSVTNLRRPTVPHTASLQPPIGENVRVMRPSQELIEPRSLNAMPAATAVGKDGAVTRVPAAASEEAAVGTKLHESSGNRLATPEPKRSVASGIGDRAAPLNPRAVPTGAEPAPTAEAAVPPTGRDGTALPLAETTSEPVVTSRLAAAPADSTIRSADVAPHIDSVQNPQVTDKPGSFETRGAAPISTTLPASVTGGTEARGRTSPNNATSPWGRLKDTGNSAGLPAKASLRRAARRSANRPNTESEFVTMRTPWSKTAETGPAKPSRPTVSAPDKAVPGRSAVFAPDDATSGRPTSTPHDDRVELRSVTADPLPRRREMQPPEALPEERSS
ncbi:hypothetical protein [Nocardia sp. SC052]|uniref:WXG100-like domain-containing protein n=1 Tax=Nocardia sichangensis TaxID=3385975 RepID=UPI0039A15A04